MLNKEKYAKEIIEIALSANGVALFISRIGSEC